MTEDEREQRLEHRWWWLGLVVALLGLLVALLAAGFGYGLGVLVIR